MEEVSHNFGLNMPPGQAVALSSTFKKRPRLSKRVFGISNLELRNGGKPALSILLRVASDCQGLVKKHRERNLRTLFSVFDLKFEADSLDWQLVVP
jgi:hypothetical protein